MHYTTMTSKLFISNYATQLQYSLTIERATNMNVYIAQKRSSTEMDAIYVTA